MPVVRCAKARRFFRSMYLKVTLLALLLLGWNIVAVIILG
jgi:hypothetical protein